MGKRSKQYEEEERVVPCEACDGDIPLAFYVDRGDMLCCDECGAEYIVKSRNPVRLVILEEEYEDDDDYVDPDDLYFQDDESQEYD